MALINVRVDDHVRDQLKEMADNAGVTLSEYIRDLLREVVIPVGEPRHGDQPAPDSMRLIDRQVLSLLHRILGRVLPEDANDVDGDTTYQLDRAKILEAGFTGEYWREVAGFETELSKRDCRRVIDILSMFRIMTYSIRAHSEGKTPVDPKLASSLEFGGFDHNDPLEGHMARYVEHFVEDGKWSELKPFIEKNDGGNSHMQMLDVYGRMLAEYRRIVDARERRYTRDEYLLSPDELSRIAAARIHPDHRS